jgi:hypothetical protein
MPKLTETTSQQSCGGRFDAPLEMLAAIASA